MTGLCRSIRSGSHTPRAKIAFFLGLVLGICFASPALFSQVYSYLDENGIRVLTNIAPSGPVRDLNVSGAPLPAPTPVPVLTAKGKVQLPKSQGVIRGNASKTPGAASVPMPVKTETKDYETIINKYAAEFSLDPKLLQAMIRTESGFNPKAVSPKGAQGLMQLMPQTALRLGVNNPLDPEENIWGGARYMRYLLDTFGTTAEDTLILSLAAYNAGENLVQSLGRVPNFRETNEYVASIIQRYGKTKMEVPIAAASPVVTPRPFQYFDERGTLNLTNIPPIDRSRMNLPNAGSNSNYR